jgi:hypothetical protein
MLIVTIIPSFPHSLFITGFVTRVTLTGASGLGTHQYEFNIHLCQNLLTFIWEKPHWNRRWSYLISSKMACGKRPHRS